MKVIDVEVLKSITRFLCGVEPRTQTTMYLSVVPPPRRQGHPKKGKRQKVVPGLKMETLQSQHKRRKPQV